MPSLPFIFVKVFSIVLFFFLEVVLINDVVALSPTSIFICNIIEEVVIFFLLCLFSFFKLLCMVILLPGCAGHCSDRFTFIKSVGKFIALFIEQIVGQLHQKLAVLIVEGFRVTTGAFYPPKVKIVLRKVTEALAEWVVLWRIEFEVAREAISVDYVFLFEVVQVRLGRLLLGVLG